jgi:hypothetical protein
MYTFSNAPADVYYFKKEHQSIVVLQLAREFGFEKFEVE